MKHFQEVPVLEITSLSSIRKYSGCSYISARIADASSSRPVAERGLSVPLLEAKPAHVHDFFATGVPGGRGPFRSA
jgi:hypothetical protein